MTSSPHEGAPRVVVCAARGRRGPFDLPESRIDPEIGFISGGERSLYELATALATVGLDVELRGGISPAILGCLTDAAVAGPRVTLDPRPPGPADIVVVPESVDRSLVSAIRASGAHGVVYLLAPPGLWGWSFEPGWEPPDPRTVPMSELGTASTFRAIEALGLAMWTNAHGIAEAGRRAGTSIVWLGTGTPVPFPDPPTKTVDVAVVEANRWLPAATAVVERLEGVSVLRVPPQASMYSLSEALAPARLLVWPSRIEGMSRVSREARGVGTVPVALDTNPFATPEDHSGGVVLVPDDESMVRSIAELLGDPDRLASLSAEAARSAREQVSWERFCERAADAVAGIEPPSGGAVASALLRDAQLAEVVGAEAALRHEIGLAGAAVDSMRHERNLARIEEVEAIQAASREVGEALGAWVRTCQ